MPPIREMLADAGITEQQWRVLRVLAEYGPQSSSTLASRASLLFPSLTRIAQTMQNKGLITLSRDADDRRRQMICITSSGQKIIDDKANQALEIVADVKHRLGKDNYEALLDILALLDPDNPEGN